MGNRRKSRELALQILYQIDVSRDNVRDALDLFWQNFKGLEMAMEFTEKLVEGVSNNKKEIDRLIEECSENWRLKRMSKVDRSILRLASFELLYCKFGSEKSGSFINGILDRISAGIGKDC